MKEENSKNSNLKSPKYLPVISLITVTLFVLLLTILHFIEPEFEPTKHLISEYELGKFGWLMSLAFFSLAIGVFSTVLSTWSYIKTKGSFIGRWFFIIISIALVGAGIFYPYVVPNTASKIHTLCGVTVIFIFPIAALLYNKGLKRNQSWIDSKKTTSIATWIVWIGFLGFFGSLIIFHPESGSDKTGLIVGLQNRFMMFTYSLWLFIIALKTLQIENREK